MADNIVMTWYKHHGIKSVAVRSDLKGKHRDYCLCHFCALFKPNQSDNCQIAEQVYALCVDEDLVLPVWECPAYETRTNVN